MALVGLALAIALGSRPEPAAAASASGSSPVGTIVAFGGSPYPAPPPSGWLWADGSVVARAGTCADLFAVVGTTFHDGTSSEPGTSFRLPCLMRCDQSGQTPAVPASRSGRFPLAKAGAGTGSTLGDVFGEFDHIHHHLHTHQMSNLVATSAVADHTHTADPESPTSITGGSFGQTMTGQITSTAAGGHAHWAFHEHTIGSDNTPTNGANPPYLALGYIVKYDAAALDPCGSIWTNATSSILAGTMAANGAAVASGGTLGCLSNRFGDASGDGDPSTDFNLPCLQQCSAPTGRMPLGVRNSGTASNVGELGGSMDHQHTLQAHSHTISSEAPVTSAAGAHGHQFADSTPHFQAGSGVDGTGDGTVWAHNTRNTGDAISTADGSVGNHTHAIDNHTHGGGYTGAGAASTETVGPANAPYVSVNFGVQLAPRSAVPIGTVSPYAGSTAPVGWVFADGTAIAKSIYSGLSASVGETFGDGGDGTGPGGMFSIDLRGRIPMGRTASGAGSGLGNTGGQLDHTHTSGNHTHSIASSSPNTDFVQHYHTLHQDSIGGGWHGVSPPGTCGAPCNAFSYWYNSPGGNNNEVATSTVGHSHTVVHDHGGTTLPSARVVGNVGVNSTSTDAANPPVQVVNYIVKAYDDPGTPATVADGATTTGGDVAATTTTTGAFDIAWSASSDGGRGIAGYEWCINTAPNCSGTPVRASSLGATGNVTTVSTTGAALVVGQTYYSCVAGRDVGIPAQPAQVGSYGCSNSFTVHRTPNVPALVSPAAASSQADTTPDLTATFSDPDSNTGRVDVRVATDSGCTTPVATMSALPSSTVASGVSATVTTPTLVAGVYYWCARSVDQYGATSAWSSAREIRIGAASMVVGVDQPTLGLGTLSPGVDATVDTTITVTTDALNGYALTAIDEDDAWGADTVGGATFPDWTGTGGTPLQWNAGVSGYWGISVISATGGLLPKWSGTNLYAGLDASVPTTLHSRTSFDPGGQSIVMRHRANALPSQAAGTYTATVTITATANP